MRFALSSSPGIISLLSGCNSLSSSPVWWLCLHFFFSTSESEAAGGTGGITRGMGTPQTRRCTPPRRSGTPSTHRRVGGTTWWVLSGRLGTRCQYLFWSSLLVTQNRPYFVCSNESMWVASVSKVQLISSEWNGNDTIPLGKKMTCLSDKGIDLYVLYK